MITMHERAGFRIRFRYPVKETVGSDDYAVDIRHDYEHVMQALASAGKAIRMLQEVRVTPDTIELTIAAESFETKSAHDQLCDISHALVMLGLPGRGDWEL